MGANDTTNDATPTLNGTGEPGSTITIRLDGVDIGTAVVGSSGAWTFTPTTPVGDGTHTLTAIATDVAGNTSPVSGGFTFTVDTTPPPVATLATVTDDAGDVKGPLSSGDTTDDTQPLLQGAPRTARSSPCMTAPRCSVPQRSTAAAAGAYPYHAAHRRPAFADDPCHRCRREYLDF